MSIKDIIHSAGQNCHTVMVKAREKDGSTETREAEPYSYRITAGTEKFFCYDIRKGGIRNLSISNIISVEETNNIFSPRWPIEV
ncbi:MAG: hypothetical protein ACI9LM_004029 [Alteromonadaceae bacterium]|jgi:hypothetical protein